MTLQDLHRKVEEAGEIAAQPKYARGAVVRYKDHHGRLQSGAVIHIEANWWGYSKAGSVPSMIYCVEHPTYHNRRFYCGEVSILSPIQSGDHNDQ